MKNKYDMPTPLQRAFEADGYHVTNIVNAVQAAKNDGTLQNDPNATAKDSGVKLASKGEQSKWSVSKREEYAAKTNDPLRFAAFSDSLGAHWKKHGDPHAEISLAIIPASLYLWLQKPAFRTGVKPADKPNKGNGRGNGRGNVESVKTPEAPASVPVK